MKRERLHNVQSLRFLAATAVLIGHSADLLAPAGSVLWDIPWTAGVDIFFVISGFIMAWMTDGQFGRPKASSSFLLRRAIRIVPTYWFFSTLMIATVVLFPEHVRNTRVDGPTVVTSFAFLPWPRTDGQLNPLLSQGWTLNYEMFFYVAFAVALFLRRGLALLVGVFAALAFVHLLIPERLFMLRFWTDPIILEFVGGIGIARLYRRGVRLPAWAGPPLAGAGIFLLIALAAMDPPLIGRFGRAGLGALMICAAIILADGPRHLSRMGSLIQLGGDSSYTLYLSHTFTINAVVILLAATGIGGAWLGMAISICLAIMVAIALHLYLERPVIRALQRSLLGSRAIPTLPEAKPETSG